MTGYPTTCAMPKCPSPATVKNRANQGVCGLHERVVVTGSYVDDRHTDGGHA